MKVLIACEESQRVCISFREKGHEAYSCDIIDCSGGHPEWHIKQNVLEILEPTTKFDWKDTIEFTTCDGVKHTIEGKWDLIIAHPPCTFLTVSGNRWFDVEKYGEKAIKRAADREEAVKFFMHFAEANCDKIAIENPIGVMSTRYKKPSQIIQPYWFGEPSRKSTCLWLKGLPKLEKTNEVEPELVSLSSGKTMSKDFSDSWHLPKAERAKVRSKTYWGVARAMAEQWG